MKIYKIFQSSINELQINGIEWLSDSAHVTKVLKENPAH